MSYRVAFALLLFICTASAHAGIEFTLYADNQPLTGGEVCFYKTAGDSAGYSPGTLFFHNNDVRCLPANAILDMPRGRFFFFARHPGGYITASRQAMFHSEPSGADCYKKMRLNLVRSAVLDLTQVPLAPDEYAGVWSEDTDKSVGMFYPALPGATHIEVPTGVRIVPLVISRNAAVRIGAVHSLRPGERAPARFDASGQNGNVVAWVAIRKDNAENGRELRTVKPPRFVLTTSAGTQLTPLLEPRHAASLSSSVLLFTGVPSGPATLSVDGELWVRDSIQIDVKAGEIVTTPRGLDAKPAGKLRVQLLPDVWERARSLSRTCGADPSSFVVEVLQCNAPDSDDCRSVAAADLDLTRDDPVVQVSSLAPATYRVRLHPEELGGSTAAVVEPLREVVVVPEFSGTTITGHVRRGRDPVRATVTFATLDVAGSSSEGRYSARLRADPGKLPVQVEFCDEGDVSHTLVFPDAAPSPDKPFDIVVPENALRVSVLDASTGAPIDAARVTYAPPTDDGRVEFFIAAETDAAGKTAFRHVVTARPLEVCAKAEGYSRACSGPFTIGNEENLSRTVTLAPKTAGGRGRLRGLQDVEGGWIFFCDAQGREIQRAAIQEDGTFTYDFLPPHASTAVVASASTPLIVIPRLPPAAEGDELAIDVPRAPARTFSVAAAPDLARTDAWIGLAIGELTVPTRAFQHHQIVRRQQIAIAHGRPVQIADVAEVAPITVRLGPDPRDGSHSIEEVARPEQASAFPAITLAQGQKQVIFR